MQTMGTDAYNENYQHHQSDTESIGSAFSGPSSAPLNVKRGGTKNARFNIPTESATSANNGSNHGSVKSNDDYDEITLDVHDGSVAVHSVKTAAGADTDDADLSLLAKGLEKRSTSFRSNEVRNVRYMLREVSLDLKRLATLTRKPPQGRFDRTKSAASPALKGLKFISKADGGAGWAGVEKRFDDLTVNTNGLLPRTLFWECIGMNKESKEFAGELFDALTRRRYIKGDMINKEELREFWEQIADQSFDSRLQTFFDMVDKDADGRITKEEVKEIISLSASANKLSNIQKQADEYAALIMEELDPDNHGYIMIENLETLLLKAPVHHVWGGENKALSQMLSQKLKTTQDHNLIPRSYRDFKYFYQDNWQRCWVLALWVAVMACLFAYKYVQYKNRAAYEVMGVCVCLAKGAAETLKLNMALILLPVCRNTITWLRNKTSLGVAVPFDDNYNFHKVIAVGIAFGVGIHGIAHLTCDFPRILHADEKKYVLVEPFFGEDQPQNYWWFVKGVEGVTGIIMVVLMAISFTLATPWLRKGTLEQYLRTWLKKEKLQLPKYVKKLTGFNAFWYSHHLFVVVYALLIVHGIKLYLAHEWNKKTTWMYLAVPVTLYASERLIRAFRSGIKPVKILKVAFPKEVLALQMSKPQGFKYKSGQYMFVKCAAVSPFEWHPFSITSAPGDDYLSVHIRAAGDWTQQLQTVFSKIFESPTTEDSGVPPADWIQVENNPNLPRIRIDGPYGAPAQDYKKYDVVLLVGLGIGATPMISILKDIVNNIKAMQEEETALESGTGTTGGTTNGSPLTAKIKSGGTVSGGRNFRTRRAYFYWVTRAGSFDWFKGVMNEVAELDNNRVIEMHNYCSSVYEEGDARSALITMLQSLNQAKNGVDVVSGTRVMSHFAKPDWRNVYKRIALNHTNCRVGVFYCGAPPPVKELRQLASHFSHTTSTQFDFHKENF